MRAQQAQVIDIIQVFCFNITACCVTVTACTCYCMSLCETCNIHRFHLLLLGLLCPAIAASR
jgi:hypothetical protein